MFMCPSDFPHDISKTDALRTTKRNIELFHRESCHSWKPVYFGVKMSKVKVTKHTNSAELVLVLM